MVKAKGGGPSWRLLAVMFTFGVAVAAVLFVYMWLLRSDVADLKEDRERSSEARDGILRELTRINGQVDSLNKRLEPFMKQ